MATKMAVGETDDPYFVELLNSLVDGLVKKGSPQGLWIIQIDNWFDHKWLRFSGIGIVDFQFPAFLNLNDGALDEFYQDKVTFPPFAPNRIMGQWSFHRVGDHYEENALPVPHPSQKQTSEANLQRRVLDFSRSACFVWYSANTLTNGRGSIMVYNVVGDRVESWFAAFSRRDEWRLQATKGIRREDVEGLLSASAS